MSTGPIPPSALQSGLSKVVNGPVLDTAQWAAGVNTVHPSLHRLKNALGLTIGLYVGRQTLNLLTGQTPSGDVIAKDEVPAPLRPLHGIMAYNHFSDDPHDRWMKVVDNWVPALIGAAGAIAGSHDYALDQPLVQNANKITRSLAAKNPSLTLDQAESASIVLQAKPWRVLSGITSLFGSSSGFPLVPGPTNYGTTLSNSFIGTVSRNKLSTPYLPWVQKFWTSNIHPYPYGPTSMLSRLRDYLVKNPSAAPEEERKMAYSILEPWFADQAKQKHVDAFVKELHAVRDKFFREGGVPEKLKEQCEKELNTMLSGVGLENTLKKIGLDPGAATVGRNGFMEYVARLTGYDKALTRLEAQYKAAYAARNNIPLDKLPARAVPVEQFSQEAVGGVLGTAGVGAGVVGAALSARSWHQSDNDELLHSPTPSIRQGDLPCNSSSLPPDASNFTNMHERKERAQESWSAACTRTLNDKPLAFMEWATDSLNSSETLGLHRVSCALGLTIGGFVGMKVMEALTGMTLAGTAVSKEKVPGFLQGFYKKLAYNPQSDHPKDRWGYVMHFAVPAALGSAGVIAASTQFFRDQRKAADQAEYIDQYEQKMAMAQAGPWTGLTALTALFVTPSGFGYLPFPFPNYGTSLGTRFTLSSGRKVIFPGLGELWTGTASRYPYGPSKLRDHMIKYAAGNPDKHPEQLEEMAIGILKPWFKDVTKEQIEEFITKVEADRDKFLAEGGVPEDKRKACERELAKHFKGAGLEQTLREIGLDPALATLGSNGFSGKVATWLGAEDEMKSIATEFKAKYEERLANIRSQSPKLGHTQRLQAQQASTEATHSLSA